MARPRKAKLTRAEIAERAGVSARTLTEWQRVDGVDLSDMDAVMRRAKDVIRHDSSGDSKLRAAKLRKLDLECQRIEGAIQREAEMFIETDVVLEMGKIIGTVFRLRLREMAGRLPGMLEGLTGGQIHQVLMREIHDELDAISRMKFMPDSEEAKRLTKKVHAYERNKSKSESAR